MIIGKDQRLMIWSVSHIGRGGWKIWRSAETEIGCESSSVPGMWIGRSQEGLRIEGYNGSRMSTHIISYLHFHFSITITIIIITSD